MRTVSWRVAAIAAAAVACAVPALAQGKSQQKGRAPSETVLPSPVAATPAAAAPFAWVDDASVLQPGAMFVGFSVLRWNGAGISQTLAPIVDFAAGLTPRVQLSMSVPRIVDGTAVGGAPGGLGTMYAGTKVVVARDVQRGFGVAVSPTLEILSADAMLPDGTTASRVRWGIPVSAEFSRGIARVFGGTGYFSPRVWFMGGGVSASVAPKVGISASLSRAWAGTGVAGFPGSARNDLSGGVSYAVTETVIAYGSIGHTLATTVENGAGSTFAAGVALSIPSR